MKALLPISELPIPAHKIEQILHDLTLLKLDPEDYHGWNGTELWNPEDVIEDQYALEARLSLFATQPRIVNSSWLRTHADAQLETFLTISQGWTEAHSHVNGIVLLKIKRSQESKKPKFL